MSDYLTDWLGIIDNHLSSVSPEEMEKLYLQVKEVTPVTLTIEEFLTYHKILREASETVLFMESPRRWGKSWLEVEFVKQRPSGKVGEFYLASWDELLIKRTKLLQSKSKQPRIVSVVCK